MNIMSGTSYKWNLLRGTKSGAVYICGLGEDARVSFNDGIPVIGVNDFARYYIPDFIVCLERPSRLQGIRWNYVYESEVPVFSQTIMPNDLLHPEKLVRIHLMPGKAKPTLHPVQLDISLTSTYVAAQVAFHLGFTDITLVGCDLKGHHLDKRSEAIFSMYGSLATIMESRGAKLWTYNINSPMIEYGIPYKTKEPS